ncbi:hypothetical protein QCA50_008057 [Cerrena zonata]|uniref:Uncharacterized protein n=1 Tax=Cerrena zonata TaxID=2478898 RepID=A0AAW0GB42_9APHY
MNGLQHNQIQTIPREMPPVLFNILNTMSTHLQLPSRRSDFSSVKSQWQNPNDILSILTIIGGDIVQRAVAQLSGHPSYITPVAFSFGWVGYALSMVLAIMGEGRLMPAADCDCVLVNAKSQYVKTNRSWILGRLIRDHEKDPLKSGLTVTFYKTRQNDSVSAQGVPKLDWVYYTGIGVIIVQLAIAIIPGAVDQNWTILTVTAIGTILALIGGALPKWKAEKWNGRRSDKDSDRTVVCLTRGNGYSDVMVIISEGKDQYRLEDIANARDAPFRGTIWIALILCIAQILLLLIVAGLNDHAWFLLAIGALGIVQNAVAAGIRRDLGTTGIHLEEVGFPVTDRKVMKALQLAEEREPYVGISLVPIFFPGGLRPDEEAWRTDTLARYKEEKLSA